MCTCVCVAQKKVKSPTLRPALLRGVHARYSTHAVVFLVGGGRRTGEERGRGDGEGNTDHLLGKVVMCLAQWVASHSKFLWSVRAHPLVPAPDL